MSDAGQGAREWRFYEKVLSYAEGMDRDAFIADELTYDATLRNLELIGEAATHIPSEVRAAHSDIPWHAIVGTRNRLNDTPAERGAFDCVPGFHRRLETWLDELPEGADPRGQDLLALGTRRIGAEAGDLVIWRTALPHTASLNRGDSPRVAQYITMSPAGDSEEARRKRTDFWQRRLSGLGRYAEEREAREGKTAELASLGRKLAGVDPWE